MSIPRLAAPALGLMLALLPPLTQALTPDTAQRRDLEQAALQALERHYVLPERLQGLAQHLAAQRAPLDAAADGPAYAAQLGQLLSQATRDKHVRVLYSAEPLPTELAPTRGSPEQERQMNRFINQGVFKVERLPGNLGYLDLRAFTEREQSRAKLDAAMALLADTEALIIDLRANGGGRPDAVAYLSSYFFKERTHLNDMVWRTEKGEEVDAFHTETVAFHYARPVWVLMSPRSVSAAEGFAYNLQQQGRAQVAGQTSMGAAHAGGMQRIGAHFSVFVPNGRSRNPKSGGNWEGVGVLPDLAVAAADDALRVVQLRLLEGMKERSVDARLLRGLEARIQTLRDAAAP
jgi:hypothetical protein